jgi:hypothetical protein
MLYLNLKTNLSLAFGEQALNGRSAPFMAEAIMQTSSANRRKVVVVGAAPSVQPSVTRWRKAG